MNFQWRSSYLPRIRKACSHVRTFEFVLIFIWKTFTSDIPMTSTFYLYFYLNITLSIKFLFTILLKITLRSIFCIAEPFLLFDFFPTISLCANVNLPHYHINFSRTEPLFLLFVAISPALRR